MFYSPKWNSKCMWDGIRSFSVLKSKSFDVLTLSKSIDSGLDVFLWYNMYFKIEDNFTNRTNVYRTTYYTVYYTEQKD